MPDKLELWRISQNDALDGAGAFYGSGRWNTRGHAVVYLATSPAGAMLEVLAHLPLAEMDLPDSYKLLRVELPGDLNVEEVAISANSWQADLRVTRQLGDAWLQHAGCPLARVPSAIMPYTWNYLLNPAHPGSAKLTVVEASHHLYDPRLLRVR